MKTRNSFSHLVISFLIIGLSISCNKSSKDIKVSEPKTNKTDQEIITLYSKLGELHNIGLDNLYRSLKEITKNKNSSRSQSDYLVTLLATNQKAELYLKDSLGFSDWDIVPYYFTDTAYKNPSLLYQTTTFVTHHNSIYTTPISTDLANAVNDLEYIIRNDTRMTYYEQYDSLIQAKISTISAETDKAAFVGCASVVKNSSQYWNENYEEWDELISALGAQGRNTITNRRSLNDILRDMVWADGSGALSGLIRGAVLGATGGTVLIPGLGTVSGAAAGGLAGGFVGGVVGSGGAAITGFIQWLVNW